MSGRYSVFNSTLHGSGVKADAFIPAGDVVLQEKPLHFLQTIPNRKSVIVCGSCLKPLGNIPIQIGALQGVISRANIVEEFEVSMATSAISDYCCRVVPCPCNCGEMYCSEACRDIHWSVQGHRLLCTGHITDEEAEFHPLIAYKIHAMSSNEIFLMAADVFAAIVCQLDHLITNGVELAQAFDIANKPLAGYVRELWWDAAITPKGYKPLAFKKSLKSLIKDTWELLDEALQLESKGYTSFLSEEYLSRTIGMFEQNNVGVQMKTPLSEYVEKIVAPDTTADTVTTAYVLEASQRILDNIDDDAMCCDDDEEEGEYEDVDEDDDEEEDEGSMEEATSEDIPTAEETADPSLAALRGMIVEHGMDTLYPPLDGTAFYSTICRINHSCDPNVRVMYVSHPERGLLATLIALQPIQPGEELVQSYIDQYQSLEARRKALKDYGFVCTCKKCSSESNTMIESDMKA